MKTRMWTYIGIWAIGLSLLAASCASTPPPRNLDPYNLEAQGQRIVEAAREMQTATAAFERGEVLRIAQTQAALSVAATATAQAWSFQSTQAAATVEATQTAQAEAIRATRAALSLAQDQAAATATMEAWHTQAAYEEQLASIALRREQERLSRERFSRWGIWSLTIAGLALTLIVGVYTAGVFMRSKAKRDSWFDRGDGIIMLDIKGRHVVVDPRRMFGPVTVIDANSIESPALAPGALFQERTTYRAQVVELAKAWGPGNSSRKHSPPSHISSKSSQMEARSSLPPIAPWRILETWQGGALPLGLGTNGLLLADPEQSPHLLIAGTSGSGKTRYGLRPLITTALVDGWQVFIFDRSGLDFLPFEDHPNARVILLSDPSRAVNYLQALFKEIERRFSVLRDAGASTWGRLPQSGPRILAVFDEFSNLADSLENSDRDELWRWARMIAAEGRKAGVHLALALQDPTHKSLDLRIRRNSTPLAFRVRDDSASRVVLGTGGAETLENRKFMTVIQAQLYQGVAFAPSDQEIEHFLDSRPAPDLPFPEWLLAPPSEAPGRKPPHGKNGLHSCDARIRSLYAQGMSKRAIQKEVYGYVGGAAHDRVNEALSSVITPNRSNNA